MKKVISFILALLITFAIADIPAFAQESQNIYKEIDNMVHNIVNEGKSKGAVLSITKNGETILCKGYGYADEYLEFAADAEKTAFRIGSVSKTFVAVAAQILSQNSLLNMDNDISIYLEPNFPKLAYPVTMNQLLTHTAGFEDIVTGIAVYNVSDTEPLAVGVRKYMPSQIYKPGEVISYSNYGIALAAYVIECITNQDFAGFCEEQIFTPLDMSRTTFKHTQDIVYISKPYLPNGNETLEPYMNLYPEGSAVSTADDMAKYMLWLLNKEDTRILSSKSKENLFTKQFTMSKEFEGIGYIWNRKLRNNKIIYDKKGETLNFYTRIVLYPQENTGIFLSFNTYVPEHQINAVINKATNLLYGEEPDYNSYTDKSTINIKGLYVNNFSSFNTPEKIIRYLVPGKMIYIGGDKDSGYSLNDERLTLINDDMYSSSIGLLKFQNINDKIIMATDSAITYVKVPIWQHSIFQLTVLLFYIILSFAVLIKEVILMLNKKNKLNYNFLIISIIQIISFIALCLFMFKGIVTYSLLKFTLYLKICGWLIFSTVSTNTIYIIYLKTHKQLQEVLPVLWNLSGVLLSIWMLCFHII